MTHLTEEQLFALVDGGVPPNQEGALRSHVSGCSECRRSLEELRELVGDLSTPGASDEEAHVQRVMDRLAEPREHARSSTPRTTFRWRAVLGGGMSALAVAAAAALLVHRQEALRVDDSSFAARGSKDEATLERNVGVRVFTGRDALVRVTDGARVASNAPFSAAYTNAHPRPAYLLLFAVDSANTVHWLYPAYTDAHQNPASVALERTDREKVLATSVVLDSPAIGALRFVSMVTESPLTVSDIESRAPGALDGEALRRDFPSASIVELRTRVESR